MSYKLVGVDENSHFTPRIEDRLYADFATLDGNGKQPVRKGELFLNARDYGAIGDGIVDDTAALQSWLNAGGSKLTNGIFRTTSTLTISANGREFITDNAKLLGDATNIKVLTVTGAKCRIQAHIDGNDKANYGINVTGAGVIVERSLIENLRSTTDTTRGISVTTTGGCTIRNNIIRNIVSVGDASPGGNNGSARAIILTDVTAATAKSVIADNIIDNITGEEGDAIQILFTGYVSAKTTISDNKISNVSRRFIKIQASDCQVIGNVLTHDGVVPALPANAIDIISSSRILVKGNDIGINPLLVQIACTGTSTDPVTDVLILQNTIRQDNAKNAINIYCVWMNESAIQGNIIYGGSYGASIGNCIGVAITDNIMFGGIVANAAFNANSSNTGVVMRDNLNMDSGRATTAVNASVSGLIEYNAKRP